MQIETQARGLPLMQQLQAWAAGQVVGIDRVGNGFETEEVLLQRTIKDVVLGTRTGAAKLISGLFLADPACAVPAGEGVVDQLVGIR